MRLIFTYYVLFVDLQLPFNERNCSIARSQSATGPSKPGTMHKLQLNQKLFVYLVKPNKHVV